MKVVLIVDVQNLDDKIVFDKHLKREGFIGVEGEEFAYEGEAHTHLFNTRAYILEVVTKALAKISFDSCGIIFQIGENPIEAYVFNMEKKEFLKAKV
ncbi:MAG: hypothetical protein QM482_06560 [Sulfurospirillum sp.]